MSSLTNLQELHLNNNNLGGCIPDNYTRLCQLGTTVHLENNPNLEEQNFNTFCTTNSGNCMTCSHPDFVALSALYTETRGAYWTNNTNWDPTGKTSCDPCQDEWFGITCNNGRVIAIDLPSNKLSGRIPSELTTLDYLTKLNLSNNIIEGSPFFLVDLGTLTYVDLSNNRLYGYLPPTIGQLNSLTYLSLANNRLNGTIPPAIGDLASLKTLNFSNNLLNGNIPTTLGLLSSIEYLNFQNNYLSGNIPSELGQLNNLKFLSVNQNQLTDSIPSELGQLTSLETLNFSNNKLRGSIPLEIGQLISLENLLLNQNYLTGCIPAEFSIFCQNNTLVNLSNNAGLIEQSFSNFCDFNYGSCTPSLCDVPTNLQENSITAGNARIEWKAAPNASSYQVQYRPQGTTSWQTRAGITITTYPLSGLISNTTYEWQVRAKCINGYDSDYTQETFATSPATCLPTSGITKGGATTTTIDFQWADSAPNYELQYKITGTTEWQTISGITISEWRLTELTENTTYEWQIRSLCAEGLYSSWKSGGFTTSATPTCAIPSNLITDNITQTSAKFNWIASTDSASYYNIRHRIVGETYWGAWDKVLTGNSWEQIELTENTNYEWHVQARCSNGTSSDWVSASFSTIPFPICSAPTNPTTIDISATNAIINWEAVSNASSYQVQYRQQGTTSWQTITGITNSSYNLNGLSDNTIYEWQVNAKCINGYESDYLQGIFTTNPIPCDAPFVTLESDIKITSTILQWAGFNANYEIQYRITGASLWQTISGITSPYFILTELKENTIYEWQVRSRCTEDIYSNWKSDNFTTLASPTCAIPTDLATDNIRQLSATFNWTASLDPAAYYTVQHRIVGNDLWEPSNRITTGTSWTQTGLTGGTNYEWRVQASCQNGQIADWVLTSFSTIPIPPCVTPFNLSASEVTSTKAILHWVNMSNANSYNIRYKKVIEASWQQSNSLSTSHQLIRYFMSAFFRYIPFKNKSVAELCTYF